MNTYSIQEITKKFDLPASTLRYYEEIGLLTEVNRTPNNQRIYTDDHIGQLYAINCFKRTGMPISKIQDFFELSKDMENNIGKIVDLIEDHESFLKQQIVKMQDDLAHIQHKVRHYNGIKTAIENKAPWPHWEEFEESPELSAEQAMAIFQSLSDAFPMILSVNLTKNHYTMLKNDHFLSDDITFTGCYDDLIDNGVEYIHENYQENFIRCFSRENLLKSFSEGKTDVYAELYQKGHDNKYQWVSTHVIRTKDQDGDICQICINRILDRVIQQGGGKRR